jgi:hypothetical protein
MKTKHTTVVAIVIIHALVIVAKAMQWRGITPLHSTRTDVERLLGDASSKNQLTTYQTEKEAVSVLYASGPPCGSDADSEWNVPKDTVVSITVSPKGRVLLSELKVDLSTYDRLSGVHRPNIITYLNNQDGIRIETFQDEINSVTYFPSATDSKLKCTPKEKEDRLRIPIFGQYGRISRERENAILDNFAIQLLNDPDLTGKVILRRGQYSQKFGAKKLLRIKNYLYEHRQVPANRVSAFELHNGPDYTVQLYLWSNSKRASSHDWRAKRILSSISQKAERH